MKTSQEQTLDRTRPHTLLTTNPGKLAFLEYRYEDTLDVVSIPNVAWNQPAELQIQHLEWLIGIEQKSVLKFMQYGKQFEENDYIASSIDEGRKRIASLNEKIQALRDSTPPAATSSDSIDLVKKSTVVLA